MVLILSQIITDTIERKAITRSIRYEGGWFIYTFSSPTRFTRARIIVIAAMAAAGSLKGINFIASYIINWFNSKYTSISQYVKNKVRDQSVHSDLSLTRSLIWDTSRCPLWIGPIRNFSPALRTTKKASYWIGAVVSVAGEVEKVQNKLSSMKDGMMLRASATSLALNECLLISLLILLEFLFKLCWISSWWTISRRTLHFPR